MFGQKVLFNVEYKLFADFSPLRIECKALYSAHCQSSICNLIKWPQLYEINLLLLPDQGRWSGLKTGCWISQRFTCQNISVTQNWQAFTKAKSCPRDCLLDFRQSWSIQSLAFLFNIDNRTSDIEYTSWSIYSSYTNISFLL